MSDYTAPLEEILFVINELADMPAVQQLPDFNEVSSDVVEAVLEEAAKLANGVLAPLNRQGDLQGSHLVDDKVVTPDGFADAYKQFVEGGWLGLSQPVEWGGQGLPQLLLAAAGELWNASNMSFALNPILTNGAIEAIISHANEDLQKLYLPNLISGEWTGTMNLTEPQAGSDLSAVRTRAVSSGDHYLISGQKIFITWGDHEMSDNVVHLVLARLPDAPEGVRGISLFLVPKFLVNADGSIGKRNDLRAVSLEHKLGLHASPTCVMSFGDNEGAVGFLVGRENEGLSHMFTMMNNARLAVGVQGLAIADRAYQKARDYAKERVQGFSPGSKDRVSIIQHPDVRRMLMLMRSLTEAARAINFVAYSSLDFANKSADQNLARDHSSLVDLLVPVAKGWSTEVAQEVVGLAVQVHGGMGFIEETGVAQLFRDARIATIYEGTTGIQAQDLVGRKVLHDGGSALRALIHAMDSDIKSICAENDDLTPVANAVTFGIQQLEAAGDWLLNESTEVPGAANGASYNFLMLMGTVYGGYLMLRSSNAAHRKLQANESNSDFCQTKIATVNFYVEHVLSRSAAYFNAVVKGVDSIMRVSAENL